MATYNVYLKDKATDDDFWGSGTRYVIGCYLRDFFNQVCQLDSCPYDDADFFWGFSAANIQTGEIVIYFVDSPADSLIRQLAPWKPHSSGGATMHPFPSGTLSEVYVNAYQGDSNPARGLACTAFHEAMHNKLGPYFNLHGGGGGGLALSPGASDFGLTPMNKELMAPVLAKTVPQYTGFL